MAFDITKIFDFGTTIIERIWPDPTEAEKAKIRLAELAQNGQLAELANRADLFKAEVDDRKSAREREAQVATSDAAPTLNKVITPVLAIGVLVSTVVLFGGVVFGTDAIDASRKDLAVFVLGQLAGICTMVIAYYFGSSSGSTQKNDFIEHLTQKKR